MSPACMTSRARFTSALQGVRPDRVPIFDWVNNPALYTEVLGEDPAMYDGALAVRLARALGLDAAWVPAGGFMGLPDERFAWTDAKTYVDEWSTTYQVGEGSWPLAFPIGHPVRTRRDWLPIAAALPDPLANWRLKYAEAAVAEAHGRPDETAVVAGIRGPFSSAWMLMGLQEMSFALVDDPTLLEDIFATTADYWAAVGCRLAAAGVDAVVVHDDQGSGRATFIAPAQFRARVLPHLRREIATLRAAGLPVILHSCGNIAAILPDLVGTGIAGLNNLQRSAGMDLAAVKSDYGDRLCLIGNVDATNVMPGASPAEVTQAVVECLRVAAPGGRYILATDHSFHEGVPLANVRAFIAAGKEHGSYN